MPELMTTPTIQITDRAVQKCKDLMTKDGKTEQYLRVYVAAGGCSGYQYGLAFDNEVTQDDETFVRDGLRVAVDKRSAGLLSGAEIDYEDGLEGAGFKIHNPNAAATCGCGHSFSA